MRRMPTTCLRSRKKVRPLIGVTKPSTGDLLSFWAICVSIAAAGGRPVRVTAVQNPGMNRLNGLVLGGGSDVLPQRYQSKAKAAYPYDHAREELELALIDDARRTGLPTLGICRGAQLMNVAAGGSLNMDVASAFGARRYPRHWWRQVHFRKEISIEPGTRLHQITQLQKLRINSLHSQSIDRLGSDLHVSAREENGVVQAIEGASVTLFLGVQFHPEFLFYDSACRRLFKALVDDAGRFEKAKQAKILG
jgi:putative glutamine amidotransferase